VVARAQAGGNWKCNPEKPDKLTELVANYTGCKELADKCDVYVCPSNLHVGMVYDKFEESVMVAPQNCNFKARRTVLTTKHSRQSQTRLRDGMDTGRGTHRAAVPSLARWPSTRWRAWASSAA